MPQGSGPQTRVQQQKPCHTPMCSMPLGSQAMRIMPCASTQTACVYSTTCMLLECLAQHPACHTCQCNVHCTGKQTA